MKEKLASKEGRAIYARRKSSVEPVFGLIKQARGFRQFLLRGVSKVSGEWQLVALAYNCQRLCRLRRGRKPAAAPASDGPLPRRRQVARPRAHLTRAPPLTHDEPPPTLSSLGAPAPNSPCKSDRLLISVGPPGEEADSRASAGSDSWRSSVASQGCGGCRGRNDGR